MSVQLEIMSVMLHEQTARTQLEVTTASAMLASLVMGGLAVSYGGFCMRRLFAIGRST